MCISGQTLSRKKKETRDAATPPEIYIKSEPSEEPRILGKTRRQKEEGETDDSNAEEAQNDEIELNDVVDTLAGSGDKQQCAVDEAGNELRYGCYTCEFTASTIWDVTDHWMKTHLVDKPYTCPLCEVSFKTSFLAIWHIRKCGSGSPISISMKPSPIYKETLLLEVGADISERSSHEDGPSENAIKEVDVPKFVSLQEEVMELNHEQERLVELLKEVHRHSGQMHGGFRCKKCGATTENALQMEIHLQEAHRQVRPYGCSTCDKKFVCTFDLKRHQVRDHETVAESSVTVKQEKFTDEDGANSEQACSSWADAYTCTDVSNMAREYKCKRCDVKTDSETAIVRHVVLTHGLVSVLTCKSCKYQFPRNFKPSKGTIDCPQCKVKILVPSIYGLATHYNAKSKVYVCRMCEYKSQDKSGMTRHIKYSHTTVRPYMCGYCEYSSVEKPKIRLHLYNHHKKLPVKIIRDDEMLESFKRCLPELFDKLTYVFEGSMDELCKLQLQDGGVEPKKWLPKKPRVPKRSGEGTGKRNRPVSILPPGKRRKPMAKRRMIKCMDGFAAAEHTLYIRHVSTTARGILRCDLCGFRANTWAKCASHVRTNHLNNVQAQVPTQLKLPYYRCVLCDYKCNDRSCMSRHIKYIHFDVHPHQCPSCPYSKVEKAKVRYHMKYHHPELGSHVDAITDETLVVRCTREAKYYYCLVTATGEEFPYVPTVIGAPPELLPLRNANPKPRPSTGGPVPQYVVLNRHAATRSAQLATPSGEVVSVNLSGFIKSEDGTMIKVEPGMEGNDGGTQGGIDLGIETQVKSEPENEYPGERPSNTDDDKTDLEIVKEVLKPKGKEQIEVVLAEHSNEANSDTDQVCDDDLAALLNIHMQTQDVDDEKTNTEELIEEPDEDEDDSDASSAEEYQPETEETDSAEDDTDWNTLVERIGDDEDEEDILGDELDAESADMDVGADADEMLDWETTGQVQGTTSVDVATDEKLTKMTPVVKLTDIIEQILSGDWTL